MQLVVFGLNHKTAPVGVREKFALSHDDVKKILSLTSYYDSIREMAILSTCNRMEVYAVLDDVPEPCRFLRNFLGKMSADGICEEKYFYCYTGEKCIYHLFKVTASLDSLVLGEGQILSQVKKAYALAREMQTTSTVLNIFFHRAISFGKRVRTETLIAYNTVSVSSAAVSLVQERLGSLQNCRVLLVGAGKMGELTALNLRAKGCDAIYIANRDEQKALALAEKVNGKTILLENVVPSAADMDVIITSTGATNYMIEKKDLLVAMEKNSNKRLMLIDIAVPRDIDPDVKDIKGIELYNMDDMEEAVDEHRRLREHEATLATAMLEEETLALVERFNYLSFQPVMDLLSNRAEKMRKREVKRALAKLPELSSEEIRILDNMTQMIVRKILRDPMVQLNNSAGTSGEEYYVQAMKKLFKLDTLMEKSDEKTTYYWDSQQQACSLAGKPCQNNSGESS
ncbi:MAG TPA: glutamyl-tRNA reductase [Candidatus Avacidaminococcus intestinavium]|uniref:Glutamyl-tRNA reductase n=1 Tax=Candidatus Avacidaminococcus intestinavium TaxID=2840684 RepID=A0A9D1MN91_9FIRM|nr:glutamyl-tRNA reductase [Candidatus Avacidaminococcus intestinavium]